MSESLRILYAEDEDDIREVTQLALGAVGGHDVVACRSGAEALAAAANAPPDLVLLDVMMPDMDGPTTLLRLRELSALAGVPVVFITAKVQPHEIAQLRELGALDVIVKPFDPMTLADRLVALWKGHQGA